MKLDNIHIAAKKVTLTRKTDFPSLISKNPICFYLKQCCALVMRGLGCF